MRRRRFLASLALAVVAGPNAPVAQQPKEVPRVGMLMGSSPSLEAARLKAFRQALAEAGYSDGQNVVLEVRYAEGQPDRFRSLAQELVALAPSVIACVGRQETAALQAATRTIPIVFIQTPNPVELGLVASLSRPGGNTTGFTQMSAELDSKRLELLHEIAPSFSRAAFLINPNFLPGVEQRFLDAEAAAKSLGVTLRRVAATTPAELPAAFAAIEESSSQALLSRTIRCWEALNDRGFWTLAWRTGCRRSGRARTRSRTAVCSATGVTNSRTRGSQRVMSSRSSKAPTPRNCRYNGRQNSSW
jgi:putative ABC transport system substrate-binding protein